MKKSCKMVPQWRDVVLPCSPSQRCLDRFSFLDDQEDDNGLVPTWPLLKEVLRQPVNTVSQLIDVIETLSVTICGSSKVVGDYGSLRSAVKQCNDLFFSRLWPTIVRLALQLPEHFPSGSIRVLRPTDELYLPTESVASLVAHQFLCTFQSPPWRDGFYDFSIWYASDQRHPNAVQMYLNALFIYFERFAEPLMAHDAEDDHIGIINFALYAFEAKDGPGLNDLETVSLLPIKIENVERYSTEQQEFNYQGHGGAVVISANKDIGFGQSATQEELYVGNCPEACPAVLFTPTLDHDQTLVIQGARPILRICGQRRDISWERLDSRVSYGGRMLFMDALEIDEADDGEVLPDLKPDNIQREIKKAYTAFSSWTGEGSQVVSTGLWGCGAFNGDPGIKVILLWIAASLAGKELRVLCDPSHGEFSAKFNQFIKGIPQVWTAKQLLDRVGTIPTSVRRLQTIDWLLDNGTAMIGD